MTLCQTLGYLPTNAVPGFLAESFFSSIGFMEQSTLLEIAIRTAKEPWSTVNEKLGALAALESIASEEAMNALVDAMALTSLYSKDADRSSTKFPLSGEVAGAAARALGRIEASSGGSTGLSRLIRIINNPNVSIGLRECALFGLGGLTTREVFGYYKEFLSKLDGVLWSRLILSVSESFNRIDAGHTPHAASFLVAFFDYLALKIQSGMSPDLVEPCVRILADHLPDRGESEIAALALQVKRKAESRLAIKVLCARKKGSAVKELAAVLGISGFDAEIYQDVATRLSTEPRDVVTAALANALRPRGVVQNFFIRLSTQAKENEATRVRVVNSLRNVGRRGG